MTYLLVCDGVAGLLLADLIGASGAALVVLVMLASWWLEGARERGAVRPWVAWGLVSASAVAIAMDLLYLASTALHGMVHLLAFLILGRLFLRRSLRDLRSAGFLSFFLLVATSSATFSVTFLFVFMAFLLLATWMLMLHHIVAETERAARPESQAAAVRVDFRGRLARVSLLGAASTFVITGMLFFVIPRMGQATLPLRNKLGRMVTGFSDRVELGAFGDIESDKTVIMRVYISDDTPSPERLPDVRWRGIVFDSFDGRVWAVGRSDRVPLRRWPHGRFALATPPERDRCSSRTSTWIRSARTSSSGAAAGAAHAAQRVRAGGRHGEPVGAGRDRPSALPGGVRARDVAAGRRPDARDRRRAPRDDAATLSPAPPPLSPRMSGSRAR